MTTCTENPLTRHLWLECKDISLPGWRAVGRTSGIPSTSPVGPAQCPVSLPGGRTLKKLPRAFFFFHAPPPPAAAAASVSSAGVTALSGAFPWK